MAVNSLASSTNTVEKSSMTAKGTILIGNGTEPTAFSVGANDRVLVADSLATNGVSWVTFTADSIPFTSIDAKGDLLTATANDTISRLAIGSNGTVLLANSATATGLEWGSYPSSVTAEAFLEGAGTKNATVSIPAGNYLAKLSQNTSITVGGQTVSASSAMTFSNAQTSVSITGTISSPAAGTTVTNPYGNNTLRDVHYDNDLWVAVGYSGIITSPDAISWTARSVPSGPPQLFSVAYGNGVWVAAGGNPSDVAAGARSTNGITWATITVQLSPSPIATSVAYGNGIWIMSSSQGLISRSTNSTTWGQVTSNFGSAGIRSVAYGNSIWTAVGDGGRIRRSTDSGSTWTTVTSNFGTIDIISVSYGNGVWVAGGNNGEMRRSTDAVTWTTVTSGFGTSRIDNVSYGSGVWLAGGLFGAMSFSTNSTSWSAVTSGFGSTSITGFGNNGAVWIGVGFTGQIRRYEISSAFSAIFYKDPAIAS